MDSKRNWLERPLHPALPAITNEVAIFIFIIIAAIITRFYNLGARVMSHDESLHTYFSWLLYRGQGYQHSPMMHGPFQFHSIALSYFLFGVSDFTARIPSALFGIATIGMVWYWRRYLGKWGALIAGLLLVISPYMLYYSRYVRNESFVGFSGIIMLYAMLRHLEMGGRKYLLLLAAALMIHFTAKETAFIYAAQALIYLAVYFIAQVTRNHWEDHESDYRAFIITMAIGVLAVGSAVGYGLYSHKEAELSGTATAAPANPDGMTTPLSGAEAGSVSPTTVLAVIAALVFIVAAYFLIRGYTWERLRNERSFDLLMVTGTIVLPMLTAFLIKFFEKWLNVTIPTTASEVQAMGADIRGVAIIAGFLVGMYALSAVIGFLWNREKWWQTALVYWVPFIILYTTVFTNSDGFFTGTVGSLGYWLVQQGVERGSQPWYYYLLIQIPMYEYLPALGLMLAIVLGLWRKPAAQTETSDEVLALLEEESNTEERNFPNTFSLLVWWSIITIIAFSLAGERMPWLTYHMAWPMCLITGWALGYIIDRLDWDSIKEKKPLLALAALAVFVVSTGGMLLAYNGDTPPFQGSEMAQLQATSAFLLPAIVSILSAVAVVITLQDIGLKQLTQMLVLVFFAFLGVLTTRASFRASYIAYDQATEFLVYAHGATGVKEIIEQATEISQRTTGGMGIAIAYDASAPDTGVSWPMVWYLRDFTNQRSFDQPTRSLRDSVIVIVDEKNFDKIETALGTEYYRFDYIRMWWPMQDYFGLVSDRDSSVPFADDYPCKGLLSVYKLRKSKDYSRFCNGFTDPQTRAGIIDIWLNRDYSKYAQVTGRQDLTLSTWQPADKMRMYIRKDVASQIWNYGVPPTVTQAENDPTEDKYTLLAADRILGIDPANFIALNAPRSLAFAPDGTFYVADSRNNRVVHLDVDGKTLQAWGSFADGVNTPVGDGTFNEPWGIAVGPDGSVYVTDTWNHRVEKFSAEGAFIKAWGYFGQGEAPDAFYGPRGLAVDAKGRVYVTDTGNKRIVVFDADGNFITQFGSAGLDAGEFDEPVAVAVDKFGTVYVTDTWNQRIQSFAPVELANGLAFVPDKQFDVYGWFGQSLENKPFIAVNDDLHVFVTDPESYRVMEFAPTGSLIRVWGDFGNSESSFGLTSGVAVDADDHVWVTDGLYNRVMRFTMP